MIFTSIRNKESHKAITVTAGQFYLQQQPDDGRIAQHWIQKHNSDDSFTFVSRITGLVIDAASGLLHNNDALQQYPLHDGNNQHWVAGSTDDDGYASYRAKGSHKAWDVPNGDHHDGVLLQIYEAHDGANQKWKLSPVEVNCVKIRSVPDDRALTVPNYSTADELLIPAADKSGANQMWEIIPTTGGFSKIRSVSSGKVLGVPHSGVPTALKVRQYTDSGGIEQEFKIEDAGHGTSKIIARADPGLVLAVKGGFIGRLPDNGTPAQRWRLIPV